MLRSLYSYRKIKEELNSEEDLVDEEEEGEEEGLILP